MLSQRDDWTSRLHRWLETLTITMAAPLLGLLASRSDPYLVHASFPWLVLVPLLVGAKHGLAPALVSAVLLSAGMLTLAQRAHELSPELASWVLGCLVAGAIAGQFRDAAKRRRWLLQERANGLALQLERVQRARELLELSHVRLQQRMAAPPSSIEASMEDAEGRMAELSTAEDLGRALLDVLASQGIVQAASLYRMQAGRTLSPLPIAKLGSRSAATHPHALVLRAVASRRFAAAVDDEQAARVAVRDQSVVAALPLLTASSKLVGVIAVHRMPFMAFAPEQVRNTHLLASYLADLMEDRLEAVQRSQRTTSPRLRAVTKTLSLPLPPPPLGLRSSNRDRVGLERAANGGRLALIASAKAAAAKAPKSRPGPSSG